MSIRKDDLIRFSLFGAATFVVMGWLHSRWLGVAAWLMGRELVRSVATEFGLLS